MSSQPNAKEFSIVEGGPLHRIQLRLGLMKDRAPRIMRRAMIFALVAWLPLLILSAVQGVLVTNVKIPFLYDPAAYSRFLLAVPLLIVAEVVIGPRIAEATSQFIASGLIREDQYPDFDAAVVNGLRLRDSTVAEIIILAITYFGAFEAIRIFSTNVSTWNSLGSESGHRFSLAGYWYALVSLPIFQFLVYRWLWRTFIWCRFMWRMSKLDLQLVPTHPDQAGGLGFLGEAHRLFAIFIFAYAATGSGVFAREILFDRVPIQTLKIPVAAFIVIALILFLGPLFMFAPALLRTRRKALHEYSTLGGKLGRLYHQKWVKGVNPGDDSLLSAPDNTSLANYSRDFELVEQTRPFPFEPRTAIFLALAGLLPLVPLLATVMPMQEIFELLLKVLR
ncbi:MAG: hypothetical protein WBQ61_24550 [Candidatus Acidiferrum sp.]